MSVKLIILCLLCCYGAGEDCSNLPLGLERMNRGIDITRVDFLGIEGQPDGMNEPVLSFTCNEGKTREINKVSKDFPDQVQTMEMLSTTDIQDSTEIYKSTKEIRRDWGTSVSANYMGGMASASASYREMEEAIRKAQQYVAIAKTTVSTLAVTRKFPSMSSFSGNFQRSLKKLPMQVNDQTFDAYKRLFQNYGTHYLLSASFGGVVRAIMYIDQTYFEDKSDRDVEAEFAAKTGKIGMSAKGSFSSSDASSEFANSESVKIRQYGGQEFVTEKADGMEKWMKSVKDHPHLNSGNLCPIYEALEEGMRKESMKIAIQVYIDRALLNEKKRLLDIYYQDLSVDMIEDLNFQVKMAIDRKLDSYRFLKSKAPGQKLEAYKEELLAGNKRPGFIDIRQLIEDLNKKMNKILKTVIIPHEEAAALATEITTKLNCDFMLKNFDHYIRLGMSGLRDVKKMLCKFLNRD